MSQNFAFAITHGEKASGADPFHTPEGRAQIETLKTHMPEDPPAIIRGSASRHLEIATILGLKVADVTRQTSILGDADSLEVVEGDKVVIDAGGEEIALEKHTSIADLAPAVPEFLKTVESGSLFLTGRPFMIMIGAIEAGSGHAFKIFWNDDGVIQEVTQLD